MKYRITDDIPHTRAEEKRRETKRLTGAKQFISSLNKEKPRILSFQHYETELIVCSIIKLQWQR